MGEWLTATRVELKELKIPNKRGKNTEKSRGKQLLESIQQHLYEESTQLNEAY